MFHPKEHIIYTLLIQDTFLQYFTKCRIFNNISLVNFHFLHISKLIGHKFVRFIIFCMPLPILFQYWVVSCGPQHLSCRIYHQFLSQVFQVLIAWIKNAINSCKQLSSAKNARTILLFLFSKSSESLNNIYRSL